MKLKNLEATLYFEDKIAVKGIAEINPSAGTCEFFSEFVPILPLNSEVVVITEVKENPVLRVTGQTFLSSKQFMRIDHIKLALYTNAEQYIEAETDIPAYKITKHLLKSAEYESCTVVACSSELITLSNIVLNPEREDKEIDLIIDEPIFMKTTTLSLVAEGNGFFFGKSQKKSRYVYRIKKTDRPCTPELLRYIRKRLMITLSKSFE